MKYDYEALQKMQPDDIIPIIKALFRRDSDDFIHNILNQKDSIEQCRKTRYIVSDDSISIGYYEGLDDDIHLIVLYKDRIEYHKSNKFTPLNKTILIHFETTYLDMCGMGIL